MKFHFVVFLTALTTVSVYAQESVTHPSDIVQWSAGSLLTNAGVEHKGSVHYDEDNNIVYVMDYSTAQTHVFIATGAQAFEYYDSTRAAQRIFYSLPCKDVAGKTSQIAFLEWLGDWDTFSIYTRTAPLDVQKTIRMRDDGNFITMSTPPSVGAGGEFITGGTTITVSSGRQAIAHYKISQSETLYVKVAGNDVLMPWVQHRLLYKEKDKVEEHDTKVDKTMLQTLVGDHYPAVARFAFRNNLKFDNKKDLLMMLDYYKKLTR